MVVGFGHPVHLFASYCLRRKQLGARLTHTWCCLFSSLYGLLEFPLPQLPPDSKKRKSGKGKSKGKGKKAEAAGGGGGAGGAGGARSKLQDALSAFGWEVSELFRAMAASLKVFFAGWCCICCRRCCG